MRVIVSGGGTGGHIYPALAMIHEIKKHNTNAEFLYIGSEKGLEKEIVQKDGISFVDIDITGFKRKLSFDNIKTMIRFFKSVYRSKKYIKDFKPDIVLGTGGFVCGPVLYAAYKQKIPTVIHEQNVIPGLANDFLSRYADLVAISFEGSKDYFNKARKVILTGNPRATEVFDADREKAYHLLDIEATKKIVLIFGGSRGAKAINQAFLEMVPMLSEHEDLHFVFITGTVHFDSISAELKKYPREQLKNISIFSYLYQMPEVLAATDLIISRAGASTLAEVTALGIPSILIPSPYVTNNHQELNAKWMEGQGAAKMIREKDLTGERLNRLMAEMMKERQRYADASRKIGQPEAAKKLYDEMMNIL